MRRKGAVSIPLSRKYFQGWFPIEEDHINYKFYCHGPKPTNRTVKHPNACSRPGCSLCHTRPSHKALKKTKGQKKHSGDELIYY